MRGFPALWLVAWSALFGPAAHAGFIGPYALSNWTLTNSNGDGSATTLDGGNSLILSGPNNGGGLPGSTSLVITVPTDDTLSFGWSYFSLDAPGKDLAGYLIGTQFFLLSGNSGTSGSAGATVQAGQQFGFSVRTSDNVGEPGILTITPFSFDQGATAVPEPDSISVVLLGAALLGLIRYAERRSARYRNLQSAQRSAELSDLTFLSWEQAVQPRNYRGKHNETRVEWCSRGDGRHV
jgi:hypothetical protein